MKAGIQNMNRLPVFFILPDIVQDEYRMLTKGERRSNIEAVLIYIICKCIDEGLGGDKGFDNIIPNLHLGRKSQSQPKAEMVIGFSFLIGSAFSPESEA